MPSSRLSGYSEVVRGRNMSLAIEKILVPAIGHPTQPAREEANRLNIAVVFTSVKSTLVALKEAGNLANSLGARIQLIVPQVVPYPLPLETPPVLVQFNENRFRIIAEESAVETSVQIYLCRDSLETLISVLTPGSVVVLAGRKGRWPWWPTQEERWTRRLRLAGY